jgi:FtsP/CotA-like multicopper oxidase with cupredoxin domain
MPAMLARPTFLGDIQKTELKKTDRYLTFQTAGATTGASQHTIAVDNGPQLKFGEDNTAVNIGPINTVEEWTIYNISNHKVDHPFHIHINPFQVTEVFDPNAPIVNARTGQVERDSKGNPIPLYIWSGKALPGQCLLDGNKPETWHPCPSAPSPYAAKTNIWWDVFPIPDGIANPVANPPAAVPNIVHGYFKLRSRFVDYPGAYVVHCHILAHEDRGMMVEVNLAYTPPTNAHPQHH